MLDNCSLGELEDFVEKMIPVNDPVWLLSRGYTDVILTGDRQFSEGKILRAKVNAWLAAREDPRPMGIAIKAKDLDISVKNTDIFVNWLRDLFT